VEFAAAAAAENGKDLGTKCPKLSQRKHGSWQVRQELPRSPDGNRRTFRRDGLATKDDGQEVLDKIRELLDLAGDDEEDREAVAAMLHSLDREESLPDAEVVRRQLRSGQALNDKGTIGDGLDAWLPQKKRKVARATFVSYESHVRLYHKPKIGHIRRDRLTIGDLTEMFNSIEDDNERIDANNADRRALLQQVKERAEHHSGPLHLGSPTAGDRSRRSGDQDRAAPGTPENAGAPSGHPRGVGENVA
jgi:hypothetical protein